MPATRLTPDSSDDIERVVAVEAPISIEINGLGYAVMMGTPADLVEFATGFALTERLVSGLSDILDVEVHGLDHGWLIRMQVNDERYEPVRARVRHRLADSGCGLCGVENLEQALRPIPPVGKPAPIGIGAIFAALGQLDAHQSLGRATGAVHAAAFCDEHGHVLCTREDVGRHNSFDKLIGAVLRQELDLARGFVLLSSRCSYELVEKAAVAGVTMLVTISAPTTLAVERSRSCGLSLISLARADAVLVMNDPHGLFAPQPSPIAVKR